MKKLTVLIKATLTLFMLGFSVLLIFALHICIISRYKYECQALVYIMGHKKKVCLSKWPVLTIWFATIFLKLIA
jgi:hypothetical protein